MEGGRDVVGGKRVRGGKVGTVREGKDWGTGEGTGEEGEG